jgi:hypothetical protein
VPNHYGCAIKWVPEFHADSFKELKNLKTVDRQYKENCKSGVNVPLITAAM